MLEPRRARVRRARVEAPVTPCARLRCAPSDAGRVKVLPHSGHVSATTPLLFSSLVLLIGALRDLAIWLWLPFELIGRDKDCNATAENEHEEPLLATTDHNASPSRLGRTGRSRFSENMLRTPAVADWFAAVLRMYTGASQVLSAFRTTQDRSVSARFKMSATSGSAEGVLSDLTARTTSARSRRLY